MFVLYVSNYAQFENRQGFRKKMLDVDNVVFLKGLGN